MSMSQYAGKIWIFGDTCCKIIALFRWNFSCANIFLINALSINKLYRCVFPLRNLVPSKRQKIFVTACTIFFSLTPSLYAAARLVTESSATNKVALYYPTRSNCELRPYDSNTRAILKVFNYVLLALLLALPIFMLIASNAVLIGLAAKKTNTKINKLNVLIVFLVTASFLMSFLPSLVFLAMKTEGSPRDLSWYVTFLSTWINPCIYIAVNSQFRSYTKERIFFWRVNRCQRVVVQNSPLLGQGQIRLVDTRCWREGRLQAIPDLSS